MIQEDISYIYKLLYLYFSQNWAVFFFYVQIVIYKEKKTTYRCFANLMHFRNFLRGECLDKYSVNPFEDPEENWHRQMNLELIVCSKYILTP